VSRAVPLDFFQTLDQVCGELGGLLMRLLHFLERIAHGAMQLGATALELLQGAGHGR